MRPCGEGFDGLCAFFYPTYSSALGKLLSATVAAVVRPTACARGQSTLRQFITAVNDRTHRRERIVVRDLAPPSGNAVLHDGINRWLAWDDERGTAFHILGTVHGGILKSCKNIASEGKRLSTEHRKRYQVLFDESDVATTVTTLAVIIASIADVGVVPVEQVDGPSSDGGSGNLLPLAAVYKFCAAEGRRNHCSRCDTTRPCRRYHKKPPCCIVASNVLKSVLAGEYDAVEIDKLLRCLRETLLCLLAFPGSSTCRPRSLPLRTTLILLSRCRICSSCETRC